MNRVAALLLTLCIAACAHAGTETVRSDASRQSSIGYPTVAAALTDLKAQPGNVVSTQQGWTIITNPTNLTLWSFTPENHPAHPAAVKRTTVERGGAWYIEMDALCQAQKAPCDKLIEQFKALNEQMREHIEHEKSKEQPNNSFKPKPLRGSA